jgi:hypothetical protein
VSRTTRNLGAVLGAVLPALILTGCGHVARNYPAPATAVPLAAAATGLAEDLTHWSDDTYRIEISGLSDIHQRTARRNDLLQNMAAGSSQRDVDRMVNTAGKKRPFINRLYRDSEDYFFYRGNIIFHQDQPLLYAPLFRWCLGAESNHRHHDFQSCALPTELPRHLNTF